MMRNFVVGKGQDDLKRTAEIFNIVLKAAMIVIFMTITILYLHTECVRKREREKMETN